ncbi:hypothetical protein ACF0H5_010168 [Mactra antiquata]
MNISLILLLSCYIPFIASECNWPSNLQGSIWHDSDKGELNFNVKTMTGLDYQVVTTTVDSWDCLYYFPATNTLIMRSQTTVSLFSTVYRPFQCIVLTPITDFSYSYYIHAVQEVRVQNERLNLREESSTSSITESNAVVSLCNSTTVTDNEYHVLVKDSLEVDARQDCPPDLIYEFYYSMYEVLSNGTIYLSQSPMSCTSSQTPTVIPEHPDGTRGLTMELTPYQTYPTTTSTTTSTTSTTSTSTTTSTTSTTTSTTSTTTSTTTTTTPTTTSTTSTTTTTTPTTTSTTTTTPTTTSTTSTTTTTTPTTTSTTTTTPTTTSTTTTTTPTTTSTTTTTTPTTTSTTSTTTTTTPTTSTTTSTTTTATPTTTTATVTPGTTTAGPDNTLTIIAAVLGAVAVLLVLVLVIAFIVYKCCRKTRPVSPSPEPVKSPTPEPDLIIEAMPHKLYGLSAMTPKELRGPRETTMLEGLRPSTSLHIFPGAKDNNFKLTMANTPDNASSNLRRGYSPSQTPRGVSLTKHIHHTESFKHSIPSPIREETVHSLDTQEHNDEHNTHSITIPNLISTPRDERGVKSEDGSTLEMENETNELNSTKKENLNFSKQANKSLIDLSPRPVDFVMTQNTDFNNSFRSVSVPMSQVNSDIENPGPSSGLHSVLMTRMISGGVKQNTTPRAQSVVMTQMNTELENHVISPRAESVVMTQMNQEFENHVTSTRVVMTQIDSDKKQLDSSRTVSQMNKHGPSESTSSRNGYTASVEVPQTARPITISPEMEHRVNLKSRLAFEETASARHTTELDNDLGQTERTNGKQIIGSTNNGEMGFPKNAVEYNGEAVRSPAPALFTTSATGHVNASKESHDVIITNTPESTLTNGRMSGTNSENDVALPDIPSSDLGVQLPSPKFMSSPVPGTRSVSETARLYADVDLM